MFNFLCTLYFSRSSRRCAVGSAVSGACISRTFYVLVGRMVHMCIPTYNTQHKRALIYLIHCLSTFVSPAQPITLCCHHGSIPKSLRPVSYPDQWLYMQTARRPKAPPLLWGPETGARSSSTQWTAADDARPLPTRPRAFAASHDLRSIRPQTQMTYAASQTMTQMASQRR